MKRLALAPAVCVAALLVGGCGGREAGKSGTKALGGSNNTSVCAYTKRFGHPMCFNDAYRSLTQQYRIKALRGGYAARPGTSEHGWGLAADLCDGVDDGSGSATYSWLRMHAPDYGWQNPTWARPGGSGPYEPWHWEYMPGEQGQSKGD